VGDYTAIVIIIVVVVVVIVVVAIIVVAVVVSAITPVIDPRPPSSELPSPVSGNAPINPPSSVPSSAVIASWCHHPRQHCR
jgi:flagellar basal body-associated protein FliL